MQVITAATPRKMAGRTIHAGTPLVALPAPKKISCSLDRCTVTRAPRASTVKGMRKLERTRRRREPPGGAPGGASPPALTVLAAAATVMGRESSGGRHPPAGGHGHRAEAGPRDLRHTVNRWWARDSPSPPLAEPWPPVV